MEYHRFYSMDDLAILGQGAVAALNIPEDFSKPLELLKSLERHHCRWVWPRDGALPCVLHRHLGNPNIHALSSYCAARRF
jgi:hypothetical protein